jgi:hypothetical protein
MYSTARLSHYTLDVCKTVTLSSLDFLIERKCVARQAHGCSLPETGSMSSSGAGDLCPQLVVSVRQSPNGTESGRTLWPGWPATEPCEASWIEPFAGRSTPFGCLWTDEGYNTTTYWMGYGILAVKPWMLCCFAAATH